MATKTTIQNLINSNLASGSDITATEHRAVLNTILNELYPTTYYENYNETSNVLVITNFSQVGVRYIVSFKKVGNTVFYSGNVFNNTSEIKSGYFIQIVNSEFLPQTDKNFWTSASGGQRIEIAGDYFDFEAVGASENTYFSGHYTTNN